MTAPICFVDVETSGLDPWRHEIWEVGLIEADGTEYQWFLPIDVRRADLIALNIGRYQERHPAGLLYKPSADEAPIITDLDLFAEEFARLTWGKHLIGAVPSFDEERLRLLLRRHGQLPGNHYHLVDIEGLAAGYIAACARLGKPISFKTDDAGWVEMDPMPPWDSEKLSLAVGVIPQDFARHTALGDCAWSRAIYRAVMGPEAEL
jgi:hypothetical protein